MNQTVANALSLLALGSFVAPAAFAGDPPPWVVNYLRPPGSAAATIAPPKRSARPRSLNIAPLDPSVKRIQGEPAALNMPPAPVSGMAAPLEAGQSISLQAALYGAITGNPDLIALRNSNIASPEAVEVARRFPTTLNPTLWMDIRPQVWAPKPGGGYGFNQAYILISYRQPIELGHQTKYRHQIAQAALTQQQWTVMQAELLALVQTYRFFQTAAYRREKLRVAQALADFNEKLLVGLRRRLDANQIPAADVVLAEVESEATRQQVDAARQDYVIALTDLRNQIGVPETAGTAEPLGDFVLPKSIPEIEDEALVQLALQTRPDIQVARAQAAGACAAVKLAKGDMVPTPVLGPQYVKDEMGIQYFGFVLIAPLPIVNSGRPLVIQREAEYRRAIAAAQQVEQRTTSQVKAAVAKWNGANRLVSRTDGLTETLREQVSRMETLFDRNQSDLTKLLQSRQRLIQLENAELDALWNATQAQADLLTALGAPSLIAALHEPGSAPAETQPPAPRP